MVLPKISENLNIPRKSLAIRTCAARCVLLELSTDSQPTGVFISAYVSEFWLFSFYPFHVSANMEMADVEEQRICIEWCTRITVSAQDHVG
jgi:hypothetical protein